MFHVCLRLISLGNRFLCSFLVGLGALRNNTCKGETSWTEQREKLNCDTIETETLVDRSDFPPPAQPSFPPSTPLCALDRGCYRCYDGGVRGTSSRRFWPERQGGPCTTKGGAEEGSGRRWPQAHIPEVGGSVQAVGRDTLPSLSPAPRLQRGRQCPQEIIPGRTKRDRPCPVPSRAPVLSALAL